MSEYLVAHCGAGRHQSCRWQGALHGAVAAVVGASRAGRLSRAAARAHRRGVALPPERLQQWLAHRRSTRRGRSRRAIAPATLAGARQARRGSRQSGDASDHIAAAFPGRRRRRQRAAARRPRARCSPRRRGVGASCSRSSSTAPAPRWHRLGALAGASRVPPALRTGSGSCHWSRMRRRRGSTVAGGRSACWTGAASRRLEALIEKARTERLADAEKLELQALTADQTGVQAHWPP